MSSGDFRMSLGEQKMSANNGCPSDKRIGVSPDCRMSARRRHGQSVHETKAALTAACDGRLPEGPSDGRCGMPRISSSVVCSQLVGSRNGADGPASSHASGPDLTACLVMRLCRCAHVSLCQWFGPHSLPRHVIGPMWPCFPMPPFGPS